MDDNCKGCLWKKWVVNSTLTMCQVLEYKEGKCPCMKCLVKVMCWKKGKCEEMRLYLNLSNERDNQ